MHHELRIYDIFPERREPFHARFRDHALRMFQRHGFKPLQIWETEVGGQLRMLYLLEWPDDATREAAWKHLLADPEWIEVKRRTQAEHGELVARAEGWVLRAVDYGPRLAPAAG